MHRKETIPQKIQYRGTLVHGWIALAAARLDCGGMVSGSECGITRYRVRSITLPLSLWSLRERERA